MEVAMHKLSAAILFVIIVSSFFSCATTQNLKAVSSHHALTSDLGYIAIVFAKKVDPIAFGSRNVYAVIRQLDTGKRFFIPFGANGEVRLISAAPGNYRFDKFIYMVGFGSIKNYDASKKPEGVLYGAPIVSGATLIDAGFSDEFKKEFMVSADQIIYVGDYSWETEFSFTGPGVIVHRNFNNENIIYHKIVDEHPDIPSTMRITTVKQE